MQISISALIFRQKTFAFLASFFLAIIAFSGAAEAITTQAKQALVVDLSTNTVLYEKNADQIMAPSSMTKIMTAFILFEHVERQEVSLNDAIKVSKKAAEKGGSKMFLREGEIVRYEDLLKGLMILSGNDAAIAIAEGLSGSEEAFAVLMNQTARELGMTQTQYQNASGWPAPKHYTTARDLVRLCAAIHLRFPQYDSIYKIRKFSWDNVEQWNRNPLLSKPELNSTGLKTGHTSAGGYGLAASTRYDGRRIIMILNGMASKEQRKTESIRMMDWAQRNWSTYTLLRKGQIVDHAKVWMGTEDHVPLSIPRSLVLTIQRKSRESITAKVLYQSPVSAPLPAGTQIGELRVAAADMETQVLPLVTTKSIERLGRLSTVVRSVQEGVKSRISQ